MPQVTPFPPTEIASQGLVYNIKTNKDFQTLKLNVKLLPNLYINWNSVHICFFIKIKSKTNNANNIDTAMIMDNNFFVHWINEIDIKQYDDDLQFLTIGNSTDICYYSNAMLKHMPKMY